MSKSLHRGQFVRMALFSALALTGAAMAGTPQCTAPRNLLNNAGFEEGTWAPGARPPGWAFDSYSGSSLGAWDNTVARSGRNSVRIDAPMPDDARWLQGTTVPVNAPLYLSGWVRTQGIRAIDAGSPGATLSAVGLWDQTAPSFGNTDWHAVGMTFLTNTPVAYPSGRIGFWAGLAIGTAWFDDLTLVPRVPVVPHPRWKILLLVYQHTDVKLTDANGMTRHLRGASTEAEIDKTIEQARIFVEQDIPALTSGQMLPTLTVRKVSTPMSSLDPLGGGWWPAPHNVAAQLDPAFDSVMVIWDPRVRDVNTGASLWIGAGAGLTQDRGLGQTYATLSVEYAGVNGHRNVYKHEWGHSILSFHQHLAQVPTPYVYNHADDGQYVNCKTGMGYVWQDETTAQPIPNSIYSNEAGFTHDYYSGTVALATAPTVCLGIGSQAWAWGGPVTHSGSEPRFTDEERVEAMVVQLEALRAAQMISSGDAARLQSMLSARPKSDGHASRSGIHLQGFIQRVRQMLRKGTVPARAGELLIEAAATAQTCG
jgi:hypothetical protein